jgi:hypothetical protein
VRRALLTVAFATALAAVPGVATAGTPGLDQQCGAGSLAGGDNLVDVGAGQGVDIVLNSYSFSGFNVSVYSRLNPSGPMSHVGDVYVPPYGEASIYDGIWGTEPVPHRYDIVVPANAPNLVTGWRIMSTMCA